MKNVSAPKNSKSGAPAGNRNMGGGPGGGSKPMPRVGGHTSNNAGTSAGVKSDAGC